MIAGIENDYRARVESLTDCELHHAESWARRLFTEHLDRVEAAIGMPLDAADRQWLAQFRACLARSDETTSRSEQVAGLASLLTLMTEIERQHATVH